MLFQVVIGNHCDNHKWHKNALRGKLEFLTVNSKRYVQNMECFWMFNNNSNLVTVTTRFIQYIQNLREKKYWSQKLSVFVWLIQSPAKKINWRIFSKHIPKKMKTSTGCLKTLIW